MDQNKPLQDTDGACEVLNPAHQGWLQSRKLLLSPDETCEVIGVRRSTLFKLLVLLR